MSAERTIKTETHGRYLVQAPHGGNSKPVPLLVGFHGYGEGADAHLARLVSIPGADEWLIVSVQGLHRFYDRRSETVVASWMTRQDRELMIADNVSYITNVLAAVSAEWNVAARMVFTGFSQGVATTYRAACLGPHKSAGVIVVGGDVPPDLPPGALKHLPSVLLGRGARDNLYSDAKWRADETRLRDTGVNVTAHEFDAGHDWTPEFSRVAGEFLARLR